MPLAVKGLSVWITSGGAFLEEYNIEADENSVQCFIPSIADEEFRICWEDHSEHNASLVACYMDGRAMGGTPSYSGTSGYNDGVRVSESSVKPFRFSPVTTTGGRSCLFSHSYQLYN